VFFNASQSFASLGFSDQQVFRNSLETSLNNSDVQSISLAVFDSSVGIVTAIGFPSSPANQFAMNAVIERFITADVVNTSLTGFLIPCPPGNLYAWQFGICFNASFVYPCLCFADDSWIATECGSSDSHQCVITSEYQSRSCSLDGVWQPPSDCSAPQNASDPCVTDPCPDPNTARCESTYYHSRQCICRKGYYSMGDVCVNALLQYLTTVTINATNVGTYANILAIVVNGSIVVSVPDVTNILIVTQKFAQVNGTADTELVTNVAIVASALDDVARQTLTRSFNASGNYFLANYLSTINEENGLQLLPGQSSIINLENVILENIKMTGGVTAYDHLVNDNISFVVPPDLLGNGTNPVVISTIAYRSDPLFFNANSSVTTVISDVLSLSLSSVAEHQPLSSAVSVRFSIGNYSTSEYLLTCVFYDFASRTWRSDGCMLTGRTPRGDVECTCSHLTNFAVLIDFSNGIASLSATDQLALGLISTIGLSISVALMGLLVLIYILVKGFRTNPKTVVFHLCICLIAAQVLFLAGVDKTGNKTGCRVIALFLQYFLLAAFMWMLREAILLYRTFVVIFGGATRLSFRSYLACYGIPAVIVAISAGVRWDDYGTSTACWLSTRHGTIWAFIAPVLAILAVNIVVFIRILYTVLTFKDQGRHNRGDDGDDVRTRLVKAKKGLRASVVFLTLLGITWVFGALAIGKASVVFFYLFALCNTLQGALIFLFQVVFDPAARQALLTAVGVQHSTTTSRSGNLKPKKQRRHAATHSTVPETDHAQSTTQPHETTQTTDNATTDKARRYSFAPPIAALDQPSNLSGRRDSPEDGSGTRNTGGYENIPSGGLYYENLRFMAAPPHEEPATVEHVSIAMPDGYVDITGEDAEGRRIPRNSVEMPDGYVDITGEDAEGRSRSSTTESDSSNATRRQTMVAEDDTAF